MHGGISEYGAFRTRRQTADRLTKEAALDVRGGQLVRAMLGMLSELALVTEAANDIRNADICVVRANIINAFALSTNEGPKIVIFTGLIKAFMFMLEFDKMSNVIAANDGIINRACNFHDRELFSAGYQVFTLLGHYAIWGIPLPRAYPTITREDRSALVLSLAKTILFLVTHELAHIKLGHLDTHPMGRNNLRTLPALALDEEHNELKLREFEADEYIVERMLPSVRQTLLSWVLLPLQMFSSLERLLTNYKDTHPMAINRLNRLKLRAQEVGDQEMSAMVDDILTRQIEAQEAYASSTRNMAFHSSVESAQMALLKFRQYASYARSFDKPVSDARAARHANTWDAVMLHFGIDEEE